MNSLPGTSHGTELGSGEHMYPGKRFAAPPLNGRPLFYWLLAITEFLLFGEEGRGDPGNEDGGNTTGQKDGTDVDIRNKDEGNRRGHVGLILTVVLFILVIFIIVLLNKTHKSAECEPTSC